MLASNNLSTLLKRYHNSFASVIDLSFNDDEVFVFDFSERNNELNSFDIDNIDQFSDYVKTKLHQYKCKIGAGGYLENRIIYKRSKHFGEGNNSRIIHLGVDLWVDAYTRIISPIDGIIHSFQVNDNYGDYGPTIILEHQIEEEKFYTLYGHLSLKSLEGKSQGMKISKGEIFAELGDKNENGFWAPHLHFQVMTDMLGKNGDFPGVVSLDELDFYKSICPDPNLILNLKKLRL